MNYSRIDVGRITWSGVSKKVAKAAYGGGKIVFQTPRFAAGVEPVHRFPGAVELKMRGEWESEAFLEFVQDLQISAMEAVPELTQLGMYDSLRRLTAFANALIFDAQEACIEDTDTLRGAYEASALLELQGAWTTERSWGLKFKVLQVKLHGEAAPSRRPPQKRLFVIEDSDDESVPQPSAKKLCFLPDDEDQAQTNSDAAANRMAVSADSPPMPAYVTLPVVGEISAGTN